jgi:hypothetical protein
MATALEAPVHTTVIGVFEDRASARTAIANLRHAGFLDDHIGFISPEPRIRRTKDETTVVDDPTGIGAAVGAVAGGMAGLAVGAAIFAPIGPAIIGGAFVAWLAAAGTGAATGAVVGTLIGLGISEHEVEWFENQLKAGRTLVTVHEADERAEDARSIIRHHGGEIHEPSELGTYGTGLPATPY